MQAIMLAVRDPALVKAIRPVLKLAGYRVIAATDSGEALDRLRRGLFELLIAGAELPPDSGLELVRKMRQDPLNSDVPAILLVAGAGDAPGDPPPFTRFMRTGDIDSMLMPAVRELLHKD